MINIIYENSVVLSADEKAGIQALDQNQPVLPLKPNGKVKNIPFEYKRLVTTSLLAALEVHNGKITGKCEQRHTHQEFLGFLNHLVRTYKKKGRDIHIICEHYSAHKHKKVKEWLSTQQNVSIGAAKKDF